MDDAIAIYRNLPHDLLQMSPNHDLFGCSVRLFGLPPFESTSLPDVNDFLVTVDAACHIVVAMEQGYLPRDQSRGSVSLILIR